MTESGANADTDELLQSASQGDPRALQTLLTRFLPELRAFVRLNLGDRLQQREEPEDIEQSVCREILTDLDAFEDRGDAAFRRWLFLNALRKIRDRARYHGRERRAPDRERPLPDDADAVSGYASMLTPSHVAAQRERIVRLQTAFDQLSGEQRSAITMAKMLGMSHAQIGAELDKSPGAVAVLLHRALARLGVLLSED